MKKKTISSLVLSKNAEKNFRNIINFNKKYKSTSGI